LNSLPNTVAGTFYPQNKRRVKAKYPLNANYSLVSQLELIWLPRESACRI